MNCIGKESLDMIEKKLGTQKFSLLVDESTYVSTTKHLTLVARVLGDDKKTVEDIFLQLINVADVTADSLFNTMH